MEKKFVNIGAETLAYLDEGQGEVVLMIHGNMSSSVHYEPLISRISDQSRCVAVDLRGFGDSTYNNRFDTLEELAEKLGTSVFETKIRRTEKVEKAQAERVPLQRYAPDATAAIDYDTLIDELGKRGIV